MVAKSNQYSNRIKNGTFFYESGKSGYSLSKQKILNRLQGHFPKHWIFFLIQIHLIRSAARQCYFYSRHSKKNTQIDQTKVISQGEIYCNLKHVLSIKYVPSSQQLSSSKWCTGNQGCSQLQYDNIMTRVRNDSLLM